MKEDHCMPTFDILPIVVAADAPNFVVGVVIPSAEKNYLQTEKTLAIIFTIKKFH